MIIIINTDGDSGMKMLNSDQYCKSFMDDSEDYALLIRDEEEFINKFVQNWKENKFELSDKVYYTLNFIIEDVIKCLRLQQAEVFHSGNYEIRLIKHIDFYYGDI